MMASVRWVRHGMMGGRFLRGFTLIELIVVVAIIAILATLTLRTLGYVNRKGAESRARAEVAAIAAAIDAYKLEFGTYPPGSGLVAELTGRGSVNTNRVFFQGAQSVMTNNRFVDPWGDEYIYDTNPTTIRNRGFFDFYSRAGGKTEEAQWIGN